MNKTIVILIILSLSASIFIGCSKTNTQLTTNSIKEIFELNNINLTITELVNDDPIFFGLNNDKLTLYDSSVGKIYIILFDDAEKRLLGEKNLENMRAVGINLNEYKKYVIKNALIITTSKDNLEKVINKLK
ncbi:hypothetical protein [Paenibacillus sp. KN14-4R]|uniref:hypothetical protein n=1 Tax=Paenibacillus sp. KN14-4R TaxID=3445773 RepID=UPI003FA14D3C